MKALHTFLLLILLLVITAPLSSISSAQVAPAVSYQAYLPLIQATGDRSVVISKNIQEALNAAQPGDTIKLQAGTYKQNLILRRSGSAEAPITLQGAGVDSSIIQGAVRIQASHVAIKNLSVDPDSDDDAIQIELPSKHVNLQGLHLYGSKMYGIRIENDVDNVLIESSQINDFDAGNSDAHGIGIKTASNITIRNCNIHNNSGDAIQINTPDYPGYERFASNILIENNDLHHNRENAVDIKSTHKAIIRNNRIWSVRAVDSSDGMAIQVQYDAQDITIIGNHIWDAVQGIEITRGKKNGKDYPVAPSRVLIAGNLIRDLINEGGDSASGSGIVVRTSTNSQVYNNTIIRAATAAIYLSYSDENAIPTGIDLRNNVLEGTINDLYLARDASRFSGLQVDFNHYVTAHVDGESLGSWLSQGYEKHPTQGAPYLGQDYKALAGSPLIDSGTNVGLTFSGSAPDRGWNEFAP